MNFDRMKTLLIDRALQGQLVSNLQDFDPVDCSNDRELPFSIPKKWRVVSLDNLSTKITDGEHKTPSYQQEGIPFLSVKNISSGKVSFDDVKYITTEDYKLFSKRCNPEKGDLLITKVGTTGVPAIVPNEREFSLFVSVALLKLDASKVFNEYLYYVVLSSYFQKHVKATTRGLNKNWVIKEIKATLVPVPPLEEQRLIAQRLKELFIEIDRAEKAYQELQTLSCVLRGQILQEAIQGKLVPQLDSEEEVQQIGDAPEDVPFAIPEKWKWYSAKDVYQLLSGRDLTKSEILEIKPNEQSFPYITGASQIHDSSIVINRWTKECVVKSQIGDLLLTCKGTVGKTAINTVGDLHIARQIMALRPNKSVMSVAFLRLFIDTLSKRLAREAKSMIPGIDRKALMSKPVPVPPLQEQKRIVEMVDELFKQVEALSSK